MSAPHNTKSREDEWLNAAAEGDVRRVSELLRAGASCAWSDVRGLQALHLAVMYDHAALTHLLVGASLVQNVPLGSRSRQGASPLGLAIENQNRALTRHLLAAGVDPARPATSIDGQPANAWLTAAAAGSPQILGLLSRVSPGLGAEALDDGTTALHLASARGHGETVRWLLRQEFEPKSDARGIWPWHLASTPEVLDAWAQAVGTLRIQEPSADRNTVAHLAIFRANLPVLGWVLGRCPALRDVPNVNGTSPLLLALTDSFPGGVVALSQAGASWWTPNAAGLTPAAYLESRAARAGSLGPGMMEHLSEWRATAASQRLAATVPAAPVRPAPRL